MSNTMLIVDDDGVFCQVMARAMSRRGFQVLTAQTIASALQQAPQASHAIIDLRLGDASGLTLVAALAQAHPALKMVMLTGYASITTTVKAIKLGAVHYLTKPASADDVLAAFEEDAGDVSSAIPERPMSVNRLEWEHLQRVLAQHEGNISAAARAMGMHRRTLQRKLQKRPAKH